MNPATVFVLPDLIAPGLRIVFCGTAAGSASATAGAYYAGPGNSFWMTLHHAGLTPTRLQPTEYRSLLDYGIGLSDVCKTRSGSDQAIGTAGFDVARLLALLEANRPMLVGFNGKRAAEIVLGHPVRFGRQQERLAGAGIFVVPSTSAAARRWWDIAPWLELANAAGVRPRRPSGPRRRSR